MEVLRQTCLASGQLDERGSNVHRLNRTYAEASDGSLVQQSFEETQKGNTAVKVAPIASQVNPGENDLFVAAPFQFADLLEDFRGRKAAAAPTD